MNKIVILYIYLLFSSMVAYSQQAIIKGSVLIGERRNCRMQLLFSCNKTLLLQD